MAALARLILSAPWNNGCFVGWSLSVFHCGLKESTRKEGVCRTSRAATRVMRQSDKSIRYLEVVTCILFVWLTPWKYKSTQTHTTDSLLSAEHKHGELHRLLQLNTFAHKWNHTYTLTVLCPWNKFWFMFFFVTLSLCLLDLTILSHCKAISPKIVNVSMVLRVTITVFFWLLDVPKLKIHTFATVPLQAFYMQKALMLSKHLKHVIENLSFKQMCGQVSCYQSINHNTTDKKNAIVL